MSAELDRRQFLKVSAAAGAGLVIAIALPGCTRRTQPTTTTSETTETEPTSTSTNTPETTTTTEPEPTAWLEGNIYLTIDNTGGVTVTCFRSEMGQGVRTAIAMILAEELDADWSTVRVEQAPADERFGDQATGGSKSISSHYSLLRQAGSAVRALLVEAAAQTWEVDPSECRTDSGRVLNRKTGQTLGYGELVETAAGLPLPRQSTLKDPRDFRIIGTDIELCDGPEMVDGRAVYGLDVAVPDMLIATLVRCPVFGGRVGSLDSAAALAVPGVRRVTRISSGVAVVADNTWAALQGREALRIQWAADPDVNSEDIRSSLRSRAPVPGGISGDAQRLEAGYEMPFYAHAPMEPMACVAHVREDGCEVWAPTQNPQAARRAAQRTCGLPADQITVHVTLIGGGFGRRLEVDYVREAVAISKEVAAPVKLMWTRADDLQHDFYQPACYYRVSGGIERPGSISMEVFRGSSRVPSGPWRAVTNVPDAFAHESFLDELAAAADRDPYELRLEALPARGRAVVELAARKSGWRDPLPDGWGRGIAYHSTWGATPVAQVAEVSVAADGTIRVHRVVCAVDCGTVVNPDTVRAQMEGGIVFGLSAALKSGISIESGRVVQSNFHDYPILRFEEMPPVEVHIVPSSEPPSGIGEMGVPPIAPALANAVYAATGKRVRHLPILPGDLVGV